MGHFGLKLNSVIDSRLATHYLLEDLQFNSFSEKIDYRYSLEHVLSDSSIIDNFCIHFFDINKGNNLSTNPFKNFLIRTLTYFGLYGIYGFLIGLFLATQIVACTEYIRIKKINNTVAILMSSFLLLMLCASSLTFGVKMPFVLIWIGAIWGWTSICIAIWKWNSLSVISKKAIINNNVNS